MNYQQAKRQAIKYLAFRARSIYEVQNYLIKKKYDKEIISKVINHLQDLGYLNDVNFCEMWIANRCQLKPMGKKRLYYELIQKGIEKDLIENVLLQNFSDEYELSLATELAQKYIMKNYNKEHAQEDKLFRFLLGRGFDSRIAFVVIRKIFS